MPACAALNCKGAEPHFALVYSAAFFFFAFMTPAYIPVFFMVSRLVWRSSIWINMTGRIGL